ncbi:MAG: hypothetical protein ABI867_38810 [Kofleriaceae bacterium]
MLRTTLLFAVIASLSLTSSAGADTTATVDRAELRKALEKQRATNLKRFHSYRLKGVYPHNTYELGMKNVWIDESGNLCAVATLMQVDGQEAIVATTAKDQNFVRIAELTSGPLIDWVLTSGLTQEEIVMIQQPSQADIEEMEWQERREARKRKRALAREDRRLAANYRVTEKALEQKTIARAGLDLAVERLAQRPKLAAALIASAK